MFRHFAATCSLLLGGCVAQQGVVAPSASAVGPKDAPKRAADLPLRLAGSTGAAGSHAALAAFRKSCPSLVKRNDLSGLTRKGDWDAVCTTAAIATSAAAFFEDEFTPVVVGTGAGFATGYFEPEIAGSRLAAPGFATPIYRRPSDLVEADLGQFAPDLQGRTLRGRVVDGKIVPYPARDAVMAGVLAGKGLELAYAADPYEAFFLEIQGSGRLRLSNGEVMRIGYDAQNGRGYVAIGKVLRDAGELPAGGITMDSILAWLRANPAKAPGILAANPSVVFFREISGDGPVGAMGVAVAPRISVAADPAFVPLGAPLVVTTTLPGDRSFRAIMVAQDTGGAIKGANRIDLFMGAGATARADAGAQAAGTDIAILLPKAAAARLLAR